MATNICDNLKRGVETGSADDARRLAAEWAAGLPVNATVALHGDLGVGKTTWVQGMAAGFGVTGPVTSPTFNIFAIHRGEARMLAHMDAYRLSSQQEAEDLLLEEFLVTPWCLAVEWPERVPGWIPAGAFHIELGIRADGRHTVRLR